ncbi:MAG TPA: sulfatase-like hydrolase/transferase [Thermoanaerobaculia bacterium]|nr:sulfatase-like hydrolase/transferase [Thermoanaerobaculia bacterium]
MKRSSTFQAAVVGLTLLATAACGGDRGGDLASAGPYKGAPIVLISIDTLRSDHLPSYGYEGVETPALSALEKDAIVYERAYSHTPLTLPSHVSLLTGRLPTEHGVRDNVGYLYDGEKWPSLTAALKKAGYATGGAVSAHVLRADTGMGHGFDHYDAGVHLRFTDSLGLSQRPGTETAELALAWMRTVAEEPFFLFLHLYEPHTPYAPPEPFASRYAGKPYDGEIAAADAVVGRVVAELKERDLYDRAVIVVLSDHGEGLGDHGEKEHGIFLYREAIQVPLFVKLPGSRGGGTRVADPAQIVDLFPTLLALAGVDLPPSPEGAGPLPGRSLLALRGAEPRDLYAETFYPRLHFGWSELTSLVRDRFHYIEGPDPELYDLAADPRETKNVLAGERRAYATLRQALQGFERELAPPSAVDEETAQKLASLGYLGGTAKTKPGEALPDPKSRIATLEDFDLAMGHFGRGEHAQAVPAFERLLASNPSMVDAWEALAQSLQKLGRMEEALAAYEKALETSGGVSHVAVATGSLLLQMGRLPEAREHAELGLKVSPAMANSLLAQIALTEGKPEEAEKAARAAIASPGSRIAPMITLAQVLAKQGRLEEALRVSDDAAAEIARTGAAGQSFAGFHFVRGDVLARLGRAAEAEKEFREEIRAFPADTRAYSGLSVLYASEGRPEEAISVLRQMVDGNGSPAAYAEAVRTLRILGDPQGAAALLRHALSVHPGSKELRALAG